MSRVGRNAGRDSTKQRPFRDGVLSSNALADRLWTEQVSPLDMGCRDHALPACRGNPSVAPQPSSQSRPQRTLLHLKRRVPFIPGLI